MHTETAPGHDTTPLAKVLNITWKSEGSLEDSKWATVALSEPRADEECPITQEPMSSPQSGLDFLPGVTFNEGHPSYTRMELECGHAFSAMPLTYHFFKNGMLCPLCRAGTPETLAAMCVPSHFRNAMQNRRASEKLQDRAETDRENLASAMLAAQESMTQVIGGLDGAGFSVVLGSVIMAVPFNILEHAAMQQGRRQAPAFHNDPSLHELVSEIHTERLAFFFRHHRLCLHVYAYEPGDSNPSAVLESPMEVWAMPHLTDSANAVPSNTGTARASNAAQGNTGMAQASSMQEQRMSMEGLDNGLSMLNASLSRASIRDLVRNVSTLEQPVRYMFVVGTRTDSGSLVEIARSNRTSLVDANHLVVLNGGNQPMMLNSGNQPMMLNGGVCIPCDVDGASFVLRYAQGLHQTSPSIESLSWAIPERRFLSTVLSRLAHLQGEQGMSPVPAGAALPETIVIID